MKLFNPIYGDIVIPDTKEEIINELDNDIREICTNYSRQLQARIDVFEEGLDILSRRKELI